MQILGTLGNSSASLAPMGVVVVFDRATRLPQYALIEEPDAGIMQFMVGGVTVVAYPLLDALKVKSTRPQDGGGLIRRTATIKLLADSGNCLPFSKGPLRERYYYGGASDDDFYFGIFGIDRNLNSGELYDGLVFGLFKVDADAEWSEEDNVTSLNLIDIVSSDKTIAGAVEAEVPGQLFTYNSWYDGKVIPKAFGQVPRIRMLNAFPSTDLKTLQGSLNGVLPVAITSGSAFIVLETSTDVNSDLRQLASYGLRARFRLADNEVVSGTLSYDAVTNRVLLTAITRNTYYARGQGYTYAYSQTPINWGINKPSPIGWSIQQSVIDLAQSIIQTPDSWMQATLNFYDAVSVTKKVTQAAAVQITGFDTNNKDAIFHTSFIYNGEYSGLSADFSTQRLPSFVNPLGRASVGFGRADYLYFKETKTAADFYFRNPATAVAATHAIGTKWTFVNYDPPADNLYRAYLKKGTSRIDVGHFSCEGEKSLIKIPTAKVSAVNLNATAFGATGFLEVVFTQPPLEMGIGARSNTVYCDALYSGVAGEDRLEHLILSVAREGAGFLSNFLGTTITAPLLANYPWPYMGYIARGEETVSDVLDKITFQAGLALRWKRDKLELYPAAIHPDYSAHEEAVDGILYVVPDLAYTDEDEMLENTARIRKGDLNTIVASGYETLQVYLEVTYGGWEDPFFAQPLQSNNMGARTRDRVFSANFDLINDKKSFEYAVGMLTCIGHPAALSTCERTLETDMLLTGARWEALDPIQFKDYPIIYVGDYEIFNVQDNGLLRFKRHPTGLHFVMPGVAMIDEVTYDFAVGEENIRIAAKTAQVNVNARGVTIYGPPDPPGPPEISTDPSEPPNSGDPDGGVPPAPEPPVSPPNVGGDSDVDPQIPGGRLLNTTALGSGTTDVGPDGLIETTRVLYSYAKPIDVSRPDILRLSLYCGKFEIVADSTIQFHTDETYPGMPGVPFDDVFQFVVVNQTSGRVYRFAIKHYNFYTGVLPRQVLPAGHYDVRIYGRAVPDILASFTLNATLRINDLPIGDQIEYTAVSYLKNRTIYDKTISHNTVTPTAFNVDYNIVADTPLEDYCTHVDELVLLRHESEFLFYEFEATAVQSESATKFSAVVARLTLTAQVPTTMPPTQSIYGIVYTYPEFQFADWGGSEKFQEKIITQVKGVLVQACSGLTTAGGAGVTTTNHGLGAVAGTVNIDYEMFSVPDQLDVYYNGALVASTGVPVSGTGTVSFSYNPGVGDPTHCTVTVTGPSGTAWNYTVNCPV